MGGHLPIETKSPGQLVEASVGSQRHQARIGGKLHHRGVAMVARAREQREGLVEIAEPRTGDGAVIPRDIATIREPIELGEDVERVSAIAVYRVRMRQTPECRRVGMNRFHRLEMADARARIAELDVRRRKKTM